MNLMTEEMRQEVGKLIKTMYSTDLIAMNKIKKLLVDFVNELETDNVSDYTSGRISGIGESIELFVITEKMMETRIEQIEENFFK